MDRVPNYSSDVIFERSILDQPKQFIPVKNGGVERTCPAIRNASYRKRIPVREFENATGQVRASGKKVAEEEVGKSHHTRRRR